MQTRCACPCQPAFGRAAAASAGTCVRQCCWRRSSQKRAVPAYQKAAIFLKQLAAATAEWLMLKMLIAETEPSHSTCAAASAQYDEKTTPCATFSAKCKRFSAFEAAKPRNSRQNQRIVTS